MMSNVGNDTRPLRGFLAAMMVTAVAYFAVSAAWAKIITFALLSAAPVGAILFGVARHRPARPGPWYLFALGQAAFAVGDTIFYLNEYARHTTASTPSLADAFYLLNYPLVAAGLLLVIRARRVGRDLPTVLDALIVTTGLAVVSWEFVIGPGVAASDGGVLAQATSVCYPLMDVLLVAVVAQLVLHPGGRPPAFRLLAVSVLPLLAADTVYALAQLHGTWRTGGPVDLGWILYYACLGAAALHPSMTRVAEPAKQVPVRWSRVRMGVLLALVSLVSPALILADRLRSPDIRAVVGGAVLLWLLAVARISILLQALRGTLHQNRWWARRETVLREVADALVQARDADEVTAAVTRGVLALVGQDGTKVRLRLHDAPLYDAGDIPPAPAALTEPAGTARLTVPVVVAGQGIGQLHVTSPAPVPDHVRSALGSLAGQVALAQESAAAAEEAHRRHGAERFRRLIKDVSDVVTIVDHDLTIRYQTPSVRTVLGYGPDELTGSAFTEIVHPDDIPLVTAAAAGSGTGPGPRRAPQAVLECRVRRQDGTYVHVETRLASAADEPHYVLTLRDVTERKAAEERMRHHAFQDPLTGLASRALFLDRVDHALARRSLADTPLAVLSLDLDHFAKINESFGQDAADEVLQAVAARLRDCLRPSDTFSRLSGDTFAVLLEDMSNDTEATAVADRMIVALQRPFLLEGHEVAVSATVGIVIAGVDRIPRGEDLLRDANAAMYLAKNENPGGYAVFAPNMHATLVHKLELTAQMQRAIDRREFRVLYQPIVELTEGRIVGMEALLRWKHPTRGMVSPADFIPLAEETGMIIPVGNWILRRACLQGMRWRQATGTPLGINVNLSVRQMQNPHLASDVADVLATTGFPPNSLTLEITESFLANDPATAMRRLSELRELGVRLAIDDFGTGYVSLSRLREFPIDALKIPKPFVDGIVRGGDESALARAIAELASTLNLDVVAEGIEDRGQWEELRRFSCQFGQGYFFAHPVTPEEIDLLLIRGRLTGPESEAVSVHPMAETP